MTPTPEPSGQTLQVIQQGFNSLNIAMQQGILGFLYMLGLTLIIVAIGYAIDRTAKRNRQTIDPQAGNNAAITALAEQLTVQNEQHDETLAMQKEEGLSNRKQYETLTGKYIEALTINSDSNNRLSDALVKQATDNASSRGDIAQIKTDVQLIQGIVTKVNEMKMQITEMFNVIGIDHQSYTQLNNELSNIKAIVTRIEQKKTAEVPKVEVTTP